MERWVLKDVVEDKYVCQDIEDGSLYWGTLDYAIFYGSRNGYMCLPKMVDYIGDIEIKWVLVKIKELREGTRVGSDIPLTPKEDNQEDIDERDILGLFHQYIEDNKTNFDMHVVYWPMRIAWFRAFNLGVDSVQIERDEESSVCPGCIHIVVCQHAIESDESISECSYSRYQ